MDHNALRCTVPVEIAGKICEFGLRPDRYYSRVPVDIWRLFKNTLRPLPSLDSVSGDDLNGCLGLCSAEFSVLNRNLSDQSVLVSRELIPTIGLSTLMDARIVYNFGDGTIKLADDFSKHESPRPVSHSSYDLNDDYRRLSDARGKRPFDDDDVEYEQRSRVYEREHEFWDDHNARRSIDRRPTQSSDELYFRRERGIDESRRPYSPPPNYKPDYSDDHSSSYRQDVGEGPSSRSEFNLRSFNDDAPRRPQFDKNFRPNIDSMNFQENHVISQESQERLKRNYDQFERNISEQLNVIRQQSDLNNMSAFDSTALRDTIDSIQDKLQKKPKLGSEQEGQVAKKKKKKKIPRCQWCKRYGHVISVCHDARINKKPEPPVKPQCEFCLKIGHTTAKCFLKRKGYTGPQVVQPWAVSSSVPSIEESAKILQMLGGGAIWQTNQLS